MSAKNNNADPGKGSAARGTCDQPKASTPSAIRTPLPVGEIFALRTEETECALGCPSHFGHDCTCGARAYAFVQHVTTPSELAKVYQ